MSLIVKVNSSTKAVVVKQSQGPAGAASPSGFSSTVRFTGAGNVNLAATTGRNRLLIAGITGAITVTLPNAPTDGCSWLIKVTDGSLGLVASGKTLQVLGNGMHVEWEGSQDAGGANKGPVFGQENFGAIGGQSAEWSADTVGENGSGAQWVSS